jgi:hypothetical protein
MSMAKSFLGDLLMAKTFRQRRARRFTLFHWLGTLAAVPILGVGVLAVLHIVGLDSPHPLARFVIVNGKSMLPTFVPGEQLLFVRRSWEVGDVVIADVGEDEAVVKRVVKIKNDQVVITGDNKAVTATYRLPADRIVATLVMPTGLRFTPPKETDPQPSADTSVEDPTVQEIAQP